MATVDFVPQEQPIIFEVSMVKDYEYDHKDHIT